MVEAVAMRTTGLGGDSEVHVNAEGLAGGITLGPRRVLPVSLIAAEAPDAVLPVLETQMRSPVPGEHDARFLRAVAGMTAEGLAPREADLLERIGSDVVAAGAVLRNRMEQAALTRLVDRGLVQVSGPTPSDAAHVLGVLDAWNGTAAGLTLELLSRKPVGSGDRLAGDARAVAALIVDQLTRQTAEVLLETALAEEEHGFGDDTAALARHPLLQRALEGHRGLLALDAGLNVAVVGLGASAPVWYPAVGRRLRCQMILPEHAGVANAIGAVVGRVIVRRTGTVTAPSEGRYRVHLDTGPEDFGDEAAALARLEDVLADAARSAALAAGAADVETSAARDVKRAALEARDVFVEATITVEAAGRPRVALG
jgi:N-methylhydantoinase A/oxoprolinase/acetone carboxylase beta subunit